MSLKEITARETADHVHAHFKTTLGDFTVELLHKGAPKTCQNFIDLAEGTTEWTHPRTGGTKKNTPFYDGLTFHRIIPKFVIQGGCPRGDGTGGPGWQVDAEFNDRPHDKGVLSMARSADPNSAGSQFFVCLGRDHCQHLDGEYTAFGKVIDGIETIDKIAATKLSSPREGTPANPPKIVKAQIVE